MIGADPELFYHNGKKFISSIDKIGGTKYEPRRLLGGFCLQEDNVSVEYNIPPCNSVEKFIWANQLMLDEISLLGEDYGVKSVIVSSAHFDDDELADPRARVFGCDPDFDAWDLVPNPKPYCADENLRSAGGHIHVGMDDATSKERIEMVRALDILLGVPLAFLDPESQRRELYGKAGACRFKEYGVEYRTPSNIWLKSEKLMEVVAKTVLGVTSNPKLRKELAEFATKNEETVKKAINTLNEEAYTKLRGAYAHFWPVVLLPKIKNKLITPITVEIE